jgi:hypothetical protein
MSERRDTVVCTFDPASLRLTACEIHEWIHEVLRLPEREVQVMQIDGTKRLVYIKLIDNKYVIDLLHATKGQAEYKHHTGEITTVTIGIAGMGNKREHIANLPPEVPENVLKAALTPYGTVLDIQQEKWSRV